MENNNKKLKKNAYLRDDEHIPSAYELQLINIIKEQDEVNMQRSVLIIWRCMMR